MARRGDELHEHILSVAKDVFLEMGFERASMDVIAARAATSKRTLYARFENKEKLYLAVIEFVRGLMTSRLKMPGDYSAEPAEALVLFCGRYLEMLLFTRSIQMSRLSVSEAARFPEGAAQYFDVLFTSVEERLNMYLRTTFRLSTKASADKAQGLLARVIHPYFVRALFGIDGLKPLSDDEVLAKDFDLKPIRKAVREMMDSL